MSDVLSLAMDALDHAIASHIRDASTIDHTSADEAEWAGFEVGYDHDSEASPDADWDVERSRRWWIGRNSGWIARERDDVTGGRA